LTVAADNGFCDPTGVVGKAVGMVEQIRSTENTRISRHNILRGKKDAARRGRWPGGPRPFGLQLKSIVDESTSPPEVYSSLEIDPREAAAQRLAFERAAETGEGDQRMSRWWNTSSEIPEEFKPISPFTMGYRLGSRIYIGELVWGENRTGVVNDTRVIEVNPEGAEVIPNFCPALVEAELFERVQRLRRARSEQIRRSHRKPEVETSPKLIAPQGRGLTLKYLLTGLARCGCCKASLRPVPSGRQSKAGRRYVYYTCPRHYDGACDNTRYFPEDQLRKAVVDRLRTRLFLPPEAAGQTPSWLPELMEQVHLELRRHQVDEPGRSAAIQEELRRLDGQITGWSMSLGNPQLPSSVRDEIEGRFAQAKQRQQDLEQSLAAERALERHLAQTLGPEQLIGQLRQLDEILEGYNPTLGNLELSNHIAEIVCHVDGHVELRGTMLGLFDGATELLSQNKGGAETETPASGTSPGFPTVKPRRRGRMRIPNLSAESNERLGGVDTVLDPERFAGLPPNFFWTESFVLTEKLSWAEANATEVVRLRASRLTIEKLAEHFGKTRPTIRKALRIGAAALPDQELPQKISRGRWTEQHAAEVMKLKQQGMGTNDLAEHFRKSDTTIRAALKYAEEIADAQRQPTCSDDAPDDSGAR
jgi:hypothetical protein